MPEQITLDELEEIEPENLINDSDADPVLLSDVESVDGDDDDIENDDIIGGITDDEDIIGGITDDEDIIGGITDDEDIIGGITGEDGDDQIEDSSTFNSSQIPNVESDSDSDVEEHQKLDREEIDKFIINEHPESINHNKEEIEALSKVFRNKNGEIEDEFHNTIPFITRFEKARILGARARQLNKDPSQSLVNVDPSIIDGYKIALEEYKKKKIPFIIKRPLPDGSCEYWKFEDLEQIE